MLNYGKKNLLLKTLLILVVLSMLLPILASCNVLEDIIKDVPKKLNAPAGLRIEDGFLWWNPVDQATKYVVSIDGREFYCDDHKYSLSAVPDGSHSFRVKAVGDDIVYESSDHSNSLNVELMDGRVAETLDASAFGDLEESFLGYGFDVIRSSVFSDKYVKTSFPIFRSDEILNLRLVRVDSKYSSVDEIQSSSIEEFMQAWNASANVDVNWGGSWIGGSVEVSAAYSGGSEKARSMYYHCISINNQKYYIVMQSDMETYRSIVTDGFKRDLYSDMAPAEFFDKYGTHFITSAVMGGKINSYYLYTSEENKDYHDVSAAVSVDVRYFVGSTNVGVEGGYRQLAQASNIDIRNSLEVIGGGDYAMLSDADIPANYAAWEKSLNANSSLMGIKDTGSLQAVWQLIEPELDTKTYTWDYDGDGKFESGTRAEQLQAYFFAYGVESYNTLLEKAGLPEIIEPTGIAGIKVNGSEANADGEYEVYPGVANDIVFSVEPSEAFGFTKLVALAEVSEFASINDKNQLVIASNAPHDTTLTLVLSAGNVRQQIKVRIIKTFTVRFQTNCDQTVASYTGVSYGQQIFEPFLDSMIGYTFGGWYKTSNFASGTEYRFGEDPVESDMTLYARWIAIKPVITFNTMGGEEVESQIIKYNSTVARPTTPVWTGYNFVGWYTDEECTEEFDFDTKITENIKLYAKWAVKNYTVTFVTNGGTEVSDQITNVTKGYKITNPASEKTFYVLAGWYKDEDLTEQFFFNEKVTSDMTLYAKWVDEGNDVFFLAHDNSIFEVVTAYRYNGFIISAPQDPEREGYVFLGWSFEKNGEIADISKYVFSDENATYQLYPVWVDEAHALPFTLTIKYLYENGDVAASTYLAEVYCDQQYSVETPYIKGYKPSLSLVDGIMKAENTIVTVTYSPAPYTITVNYYIKNGDSTTPYSTDLKNCSYGDKYEINVPQKTGYIADVNQLVGIMGADNKEFTVTYSPISYQVAYNANGGEGDMASTEMTYDASAPLLALAFNKNGYAFEGWNTKADGSGIAYLEGAHIKNLSSESGAVITLYAIWSPIEYKVSFIPDSMASSGDNQSKVLTDITFDGTTSSVTFDSGYKFPVPTAKYYIFSGWCTADGVQLTDGNGESLAPWSISTDITLVGVWQKEKTGYYYISTAEEFDSIRDNMAGNYLLVNDIDISGTDWEAFGGTNLEEAFTGILDGDNHSIIGFTRTKNVKEVKSRSFFGLFGCIGSNGVVKNIVFDDVSVYITGPANNNENMRAYFGVVSGKCMGTISGVTLNGTYVYSCCTNGVTYVGGVSGCASSATIEYCTNNMTIKNDRYAAYSSGIVGYAEGGTIKYCSNKGDISTIGTDWGGTAYTAGIVATIYGSIELLNNSNNGKLTAKAYDNSYWFGGCDCVTEDIYASNFERDI